MPQIRTRQKDSIVYCGFRLGPVGSTDSNRIETQCKSSWTGTPTPPSDDARGGSKVQGAWLEGVESWVSVVLVVGGRVHGPEIAEGGWEEEEEEERVKKEKRERSKKKLNVGPVQPEVLLPSFRRLPATVHNCSLDSSIRTFSSSVSFTCHLARVS